MSSLNKYILGVLFLSALALGGLVYWYSIRSSKPCAGIQSYVPERDRDIIIQLFSDNWYWLVPDNDPFSIERFLDQSNNRQGNGPDDTKIFVYCHNGKPVGMVSYYKESLDAGRLRSIVIEQAQRGKGISEKLMDHAMNDMKKMGLSKVTLITRTNNQGAIKLYDKLNFVRTKERNGYVTFEKSIAQTSNSTTEKIQKTSLDQMDVQKAS